LEILKKSSIFTSQNINSKEDATKLAGKILYDNGYISKEYVDSMLEKLEKESYATYIGNGVAIPHGMESGKKFVKNTGISYIQCPKGVEWNGETAYLIVGIAAKDDDHMGVLSTLAELIEDPVDAKKLCEQEDKDLIYLKFINFE
tara:strand:- start:2511 stop:2945 length:435 start_codon:yes stop_codon:yes gene_type:complete